MRCKVATPGKLFQRKLTEKVGVCGAYKKVRGAHTGVNQRAKERKGGKKKTKAE